MAETIRWGIFSTGNIAGQFARDLQVARNVSLEAVASRTIDKAEAFAEEHNAKKAYGAYEELAADPEIDVVYVATPHVYHKRDTLMCLEHGKHVLCEKPFAVNARDAAEMFAAAKAAERFLMEAMWMRFFPSIQKTLELVQQGAIGEVRMLRADFTFKADLEAGSRLIEPKLGGGALLDIGIYPLALAHAVFKEPPETIATLAHLGETGVDLQSGMVLDYSNGALAVLSCSFETAMPQEAIITGTDGYIRIPHEFSHSDTLVLCRDGREDTMRFDRRGIGYYWEAEEAGRCIREGRLESRVMPPGETLALLETMDAMRDSWGLVYPHEE